ncbi:MAG: hypothetical protein E7626_07045 [Ruminococcaceae bacterium]|nr:hypothetical protein [Oscillospiraceae bacterium]
MKKSVVILILVIYLASVALVSFFGLQYKTFDEIIYTEKIEFLNDDIKTMDDGSLYAVVKQDESTGLWVYQIKYRVYPDNATNSEVEYIYDTQKPGVTVDTTTGVVTFEERGALKVTIKPKDGTDISATVTLRAR